MMQLNIACVSVWIRVTVASRDITESKHYDRSEPYSGDDNLENFRKSNCIIYFLRFVDHAPYEPCRDFSNCVLLIELIYMSQP